MWDTMSAKLIITCVILAAVVLLGTALALLHLRANGVAPPPMPLGLLHGLLAIIGPCCLALALRTA
jgi:hypothetical protein